MNDNYERWIAENLDGGRAQARELFDRDEVVQAMKSERGRILKRAKYIYDAMGSQLHNPGDMINHLIRELEANQQLKPGELDV